MNRCKEEIIFERGPRNYNKWIDNNFLYYFNQKKKKKKFNQDRISLIISNIYSMYIYIHLNNF